MEEVRALAVDGVKEVTLLGQNVNSYRGVGPEGLLEKSQDPYVSFTGLVKEIHKIEGIKRIRFMTSHPKDLSDELIEAYLTCEKLGAYIHLPVQSGSTKVLKAMNRGYSREDYLLLVRKLKKAVPHIAITTDIIVGFPGETEEDFQETLSLCEEVGYDAAFTFIYSQRRGTPAVNFPDQVPEDVAHQRFNRLIEVLTASGDEKNRAYLGQVVEVLVDDEGKRPGVLTGRTQSFKNVSFQGPPSLIGEFVNIKITRTNPFALEGELVLNKDGLN